VRSISPETQRLISDLHRRRTFWTALRSSDVDVSLLNSIGDSKETAALLDVLPFTLSSKRDVAAAATAAAHKLVLATTADDMAWLDGALRWQSRYSGDLFDEWYKVKPQQVASFERLGAASVSLLGMLSFHHSGYVRQAALNSLDNISGGSELRFLILRLNDWVANVRDTASKAIRSRLRPEYAAPFIQNLPLVARLEGAGRADHKELVQAIDQLLQSDACRPALFDSLRSNNRLVRRAGLRLLLSSAGAELEEVARQALADRDTVIRLTAAQNISSLFSGDTLEQFLTLMSRDRYTPVRREALRNYVAGGAQAAQGKLKLALLDRHQAMREEARYHLRTIAPMDFAAFYRQTLLAAPRDLLATVSCLCAAVSGLGETGIASDDTLILPYVLDMSPRLRTATIKALNRLNGKAHLGLFLRALRDEVPAVSRQALVALSDKPALVGGEAIWAILASAETPHVKRNALSLLEKLGKWTNIYYLVKAIRDSDEEIVNLSRSAIHRWLIRFNRSFTQPTANQIEKLSDAIGAAGDLLNEKTKAQLLFSMKSP